MSLRFRAAHAPSGNGIVERNHRSVKVIAARKQCSIAEAVHLYNITPRDGTTATEAPASVVYRYRVQQYVQPTQEQTAEGTTRNDDASEDYSTGDAVWIRKRGARCTSMSQPCVVKRVTSSQVVEVDGMPRHVRDVRHRNFTTTDDFVPPCMPDAEDDPPLYIGVPMQHQQSQRPRTLQVKETIQETVVPHEERTLRRSVRVRRPPQRYGYDLEDQGGV